MNRRASSFGWMALVALSLLSLASGCVDQGANMSKEEAKDKIFAPTDVNSLSPEARAKIPANGLGPAGSGGASQPGPGATAPPNVTTPRSGS